MKQNKKINYWAIAALAGVLATGFAIYEYLQEPSTAELDEDETQQLENSIRYTNRPITIILSESVLSSKIPLVEILNKTENIVLVIPPDLSLDDLEPIDESIKYKVIECDTLEGVWSVVKHLQSEVVFVVPDDMNSAVPDDVGRYVQEIVELDQHNTEINGRILSYIIT